MVQAVADLGLALPLVIPPQSPAVLVNAQTDVQGVAASFRGKRQAYGFGDRGLTPLFRIGLTAVGPIV
jgi:hypothetical protein